MLYWSVKQKLRTSYTEEIPMIKVFGGKSCFLFLPRGWPSDLFRQLLGTLPSLWSLINFNISWWQRALYFVLMTMTVQFHTLLTWQSCTRDTAILPPSQGLHSAGTCKPRLNRAWGRQSKLEFQPDFIRCLLWEEFPKNYLYGWPFLFESNCLWLRVAWTRKRDQTWTLEPGNHWTWQRQSSNQAWQQKL